MKKIEKREKAIDELEPLPEEDILYEMIEYDFVAKIPPKKKYQIQVVVNNIKKGEPKTIMPNDLLAIDKEGG